MTKQSSRWKQLLLRAGMPLIVIFVWLGLSGIGGPYFGKIDEVSSNDLATFLPKNAESTKVKDELSKFQDAKAIPAIVVFESAAPLTDAQKAEIVGVKTTIDNSGVLDGAASSPIVSEDGKAEFMLAPLDSNSEFDVAITQLKKQIDSTDLSIAYKVTGPAMFARDINKAFAGIDGTLLFVALTVVFVILFIVYRSCLL